MARTRTLLALPLIAAFLVLAAACVQQNNPQGWAGAVASEDGSILVASTDKGKLSALDPADDFAVLWTFPSGEEDPKLDLEAIYSTPVVAGGTVYFGAYDSKVYALDLEDGAPAWERPFDTGGPIVSGLTASETAVYAASEDGNVYALDPETGEQVWERPFGTGAEVWGAPLLDGDRLYVASVNGKLFALDAAAGNQLWAPFQSEHGLISDPVLADGTILVGGIGRTLHAVDVESGEERWSFKSDNWFWGRPLVDEKGGTVYAPNLDGRLYALSLEDGSQAWSAPFEAREALRAAPVTAGNILVVVDRKGNAYGINPKDGSTEWGPLALGKTVLADPLFLDGKVIVSAEGGGLFTLDPEAGKSVELAPR